MAKLAVLDPGVWDDLEGYSLWIGGAEVDWLPKKFGADQIFSMMVRYEIDQCWVAPGAAHVRQLQPSGICIMFERPEDEQGKSFINDAMEGWRFNKYGDDFLSSVHGYRSTGSQAERKLRSVIWPEFSGWQWEPGMDGTIMLAALERLQSALGVDLSSSPGVTGRKFILGQLADQQHTHWLGSVAMDLDQLPMKSGVADLAWKKSLGATGPEVLYNLFHEYPGKLGNPEKFYLHAIDKNSMYLSAAAGLPLGIGNPTHYGPECFLNLEPPKLNGAGLYQVSVTPPDAISDAHPWHLLYDGSLGPDPLYGTPGEENRQQYVSTSLLKLLYDFGYGVHIHQAWIWPNSKRILEVPATRLWQLRQELKQESLVATLQAAASALTYDWIKTIATSMVGLFASAGVKDARYKRADIWRAIIETAKARMLYNIDKIAEEMGIFPIGVKTDAIYYVSPEPDVRQALGKIMDRSDQLGGFKLEFSLEIDDAVAAALAQPGISSMTRELDKILEKRSQEVWMQK